LTVGRETGTPTIAIVGAGPRGLYCLEALSAAFRDSPLCTDLHVAVFNKSNRFGASPIYDPGQPPWLLSNGRAKEINVGGPGSGFLHWYNTTFRPSAPIGSDAFPPRAVVGRYLCEVFQRVASRIPVGMRLSTFTSEVTDIVPGENGYCLRFVDAKGRGGRLVAHKIVLATGHSVVRLGKRERRYREFATRHPRALFMPYSYPVVENMSRIPAAARVAMKGIGLTFIDAVLALTEGRGGVFTRDADGQLRYRTSGQEPETIIPFCRTGLPMTPKARDYPSSPRPLVFVTAERLAELRRRSPGGKLDLDKDVWPLVECEMERQYYRTAMTEPHDRWALDECGADAMAMRRVIHRYLASRPRLTPFDFGRVLDPVGARRVMTGEEYNSFVEDYLRREIDHARAGLASSPARAAVSLWHEIRATLKPFVAFGGLTPDSHRALIEHYFPLFKRVVFGPPLVNAEKVLALHRAGILDFSVARNPRLTTRHTTGRFELRTGRPAAAAQVEVLVDARYPTVEIQRDGALLYQGLRRRRMIREFSNRTYRTGAIDMSGSTQYVIDQRGRPNTDIAVYGAPTEGNLIATFTISRDGYATAWAANVLDQLRAGARR
jgi:hypothetical protein